MNLYFYSKVLWLLLARQVVPPDAIREDYDRLSGSYDRYFADRTAKHARHLVARLELRPGDRVLDLATGTGNLALALAEAVGASGAVVGVDQSPGMLAQAEVRRQQAGFRQLRWVQGDMLAELAAFPDQAFDAVTCGWAIGYSDPPQLVRAIGAKLRPGGKLGLIENARDTLAPIRAASLKVAQTLPRHLRRVMDLHRRLPRDGRDLQSWFRGAGLRTRDLWEGREDFCFSSGAEALDWVLHTGASAGFDRMMAPEARDRCDALFIRYLEETAPPHGKITAAHHFVAGIAHKETMPCT